MRSEQRAAAAKSLADLEKKLTNAFEDKLNRTLEVMKTAENLRVPQQAAED